MEIPLFNLHVLIMHLNFMPSLFFSEGIKNYNDVVSSQGVFFTQFAKSLNTGIEECADITGPVSHGLGQKWSS